MTAYFQDHFLIAMPALNNSFFHQSVVYICEHDANGAMGLIINKPMHVMLTELLGHLDIENVAAKRKPMPVLLGGPVEKNQGMVIHNSREGWKTSMQLANNIFLTTSTDILEKIGTEEGPDNALVTLGYSSWHAGQLEEEIIENSWLTVPAEDKIIFHTPADKRWHEAAKLLGFDINLMSSTIGHA